MATYHQYSEIVAAYGYKLPPPARAEGSRLALPLLYAAIGVALGTFAGTAMAVASLQPAAAMSSTHLTFASVTTGGFKIHPIANASQGPVIQNHASSQVSSVTPAPVLQSHPVAPTVDAGEMPVIKLHPVSAASAVPATVKPVLASHPVAAPVKLASDAPVHFESPRVQSAPIQSPMLSAKAPAISVKAPAVTPAAHKSVSADKLIAANLPDTKLARPQPLSAPAPAAISSSADAAGLDGGFKALLFYSEGDVTVMDYNAANNTIETSDGKTFSIGTTVTASNATSWDDYRSNVHYRCDQNGSCSLVRTGVVALNARMI
jgi:hypothetical protein